MAEQLSHTTSRASETTDVGSHLTRIRRHRDERTGQYILSIDGEPLPLISASTPQPSVFTGIGAHQQHAYTATLLPVFPAAIPNRTGTKGAGSESEGPLEISQFLQFAPPWAATQLSQTQVTSIGREPGAELPINDPTVSRRHAQIACIRQRYMLHDLGSKNGTFVNDTRLKPDEVWMLNPNDRIRFGKGMTYIFQVHPAGSTTNQGPDTTVPWR
jgi:FHA domain